MVEPVLFLALFCITLAVALPNALRYAERIGQPGYVGLGLGLGATVLFWVCIVAGFRGISAGVRGVVRLTGFVVNRLRPRHPRP